MMESSKQRIFQESRRVVRAGITAVESVPEYLRVATQTLKALTSASDYTYMGIPLSEQIVLRHERNFPSGIIIRVAPRVSLVSKLRREFFYDM